jgi:hypothetical protein
MMASHYAHRDRLGQNQGLHYSDTRLAPHTQLIDGAQTTSSPTARIEGESAKSG